MSKRKKTKYPGLDPSVNLKSRRDYIDNRHYVKGVEYKGIKVIPELDEKAKKFLNDFNLEYYNSAYGKGKAFTYDNIHKCQIDKETLDDLKNQIKEIKKERKKIWTKSAEKTTDEDRDKAKMLTEQIENIEEFIYKVHPRRETDDMNNARNVDLLNMSKASNKYDIVSWETLDENVSDEQLDLSYFEKSKKKKSE